MGDPLIDEATALMTLRQPVTVDTLPYIQNASMLVLIDLYDRKVTREEFALSAGRCVSLYATLAKLAVLANARMVFEAGDFTAENLDASAEKLIIAATEKTVVVAKALQLLMQCAVSQDSVH